MRIKNFAFSKIQRNPVDVDKKINEFLETQCFKGAQLTESMKYGKMILSICHTNSKSTIRAKTFRDADPKRVEEATNKFLVEGHEFKFIVHSYASSRMTSILFYVPKKEEAKLPTPTAAQKQALEKKRLEDENATKDGGNQTNEGNDLGNETGSSKDSE